MTDIDNDNTPTASSPELHIDKPARDAYLGYAALASFTPEMREQGLQSLEGLDEKQSEKIRKAFVSIIQVLLEARGLSSLAVAVEASPDEFIPLEIVGTKLDSLKRTLHWVGERYLASIVGSVDDLELGIQTIPVIVNVLIGLRGDVQIDRRSLDHAELFAMRLVGLSTEEIALKLGTSKSRVKGNFFRLHQIIVDRNSDADKRQSALRDALSEAGMLVHKTPLTAEEIDANLPPRVPQSPRSNRKRSSVKKVAKTDLIVPQPTRLRDLPYVPYEMPDNLLPNESIAQRRERLKEEARMNSASEVDH